jgi:hypothetical protein
MRYYQYISDSKVDMLLPQIPLQAKQTITAEIGFDIKILSATLKTERDSLDDRVSRLLVVERYLRETQRIGSLRDPAPWISDTQDVQVGFFREERGMVGFLGKVEGTYFMLGGSSQNIIGSRPRDTIERVPYSSFAGMTDIIMSAMEVINKDLEGRPATATEFNIDQTDGGFTLAWYRLIEHRLARPIPKTRMEFIARRLFVTSVGSTYAKLFVGTPLYVAQTDDDYVH